MSIANVAIIGAGLAGLSCAKTLAAHGVAVTLFDKGRGAGGRMATRRAEIDGQAVHFDHGAQYLTARGKFFAATLEAVHAKEWPQAGRFVGAPRMSQIPRALAEGLDIHLARHVVGLAGGPGAWMVQHMEAARIRPGRPRPADAPAEAGPFGAVIIAVPAPQAAELLQPTSPRLAGLLDGVVMAPCWTLMAAFAARPPLPDWLQLAGGPIAWLARDSAKPGRDHARECWVVQASAAWSREHLEQPAEQVAALLLDAFGKLAGAALPGVQYAAAHRWRHALTETPLGVPCLWDAALSLGAAGDWCLGQRAESAAESGRAAAAAIRKT
jgi:hypothetical protein